MFYSYLYILVIPKNSVVRNSLDTRLVKAKKDIPCLYMDMESVKADTVILDIPLTKFMRQYHEPMGYSLIENIDNPILFMKGYDWEYMDNMDSLVIPSLRSLWNQTKYIPRLFIEHDKEVYVHNNTITHGLPEDNLGVYFAIKMEYWKLLPSSSYISIAGSEITQIDTDSDNDDELS